MNGSFLSKLALSLALAGIIGAVTTYAQVQVIEDREQTNSHEIRGTRTAVDDLREDVAEVDKKAALNEAYLKAIAEKVGAKVDE